MFGDISYLKSASILALGILVSACTTHKNLDIGSFSNKDLSPWQERIFNKKTSYEIIEEQGNYVVKADSEQSASALYHQIDVDLNKTPYLNWRWKISNTLKGVDETTKEGDDYPARLYVVIPGKGFQLTPRSLNYVWASDAKEGSDWVSAYTKKVHLLALQSGDNKAGQWVVEKRNIKEDLKQYFGENINQILGIAIMTDTDNSQQSAVSYYGDIFFSKK